MRAHAHTPYLATVHSLACAFFILPCELRQQVALLKKWRRHPVDHHRHIFGFAHTATGLAALFLQKDLGLGFLLDTDTFDPPTVGVAR